MQAVILGQHEHVTHALQQLATKEPECSMNTRDTLNRAMLRPIHWRTLAGLFTFRISSRDSPVAAEKCDGSCSNASHSPPPAKNCSRSCSSEWRASSRRASDGGDWTCSTASQAAIEQR